MLVSLSNWGQRVRSMQRSNTIVVVKDKEKFMSNDVSVATPKNYFTVDKIFNMIASDNAELLYVCIYI